MRQALGVLVDSDIEEFLIIWMVRHQFADMYERGRRGLGLRLQLEDSLVKNLRVNDVQKVITWRRNTKKKSHISITLSS